MDGNPGSPVIHLAALINVGEGSPPTKKATELELHSRIHELEAQNEDLRSQVAELTRQQLQQGPLLEQHQHHTQQQKESLQQTTEPMPQVERKQQSQQQSQQRQSQQSQQSQKQSPRRQQVSVKEKRGRAKDRTEAKVLTSAEDFKILFENTPDPYCLFGVDQPHFTILAVNDAYLSATHRKREDVVGKPVFEVFPDNPDAAESSVHKVYGSLQRVLCTRQSDTMSLVKFDVRDVATGEFMERYWLPTHWPIFDKDGGMLFILHATENVTEFMNLKKQGSEQASELQAQVLAHTKRVEESQKRYHRLTTLLPIGIFHTTSTGELSYVNEAWQRMTNVQWRDVADLGKRWYDCIPTHQTEAAKAWREKPGKFSLEYASGLAWFAVHLVPEIVAESEEPTGYLGYIIDITERKQSEEAQRKRAEDLAALDKAKTVFFSNISHELRTPLTLILGPAEDSLGEQGKQALPSRQRERMEVIQRSAQRLLKLVNSSLDFTRIEEGRQSANFELTKLAQFTEMLAQLFEPVMQKAGLVFEMDIQSITCPVYVDRDLWQKIVFNLLSNALKYTMKGVVTLSMKQEGQTVKLAIQDTGVGIPATELPHMFERFHRVIGCDGRSHEGAGIGLSLTQELVKLHGGILELVSELGRGTTFTVIIPTGKAHLPEALVKDSPPPIGANSLTFAGSLFVKEAMSWLVEPVHDTPFRRTPTSGSRSIDTSPERTPPLPHAQSPHSRGSLDIWPSGVPLGSPLPLSASGSSALKEFKILIAEDNVDMQNLLLSLLSQEYIVKIAPNGVAAWEAVKNDKFDLVISDVMMPKMDGFQLIKTLRADEKTQTLPVILLSARSDEESRLQGLKFGADDYVTKPFSKRELLQRVGGRVRAGRWRHQLTQDLHHYQDESQRQKRLMQLISHELRNPLVGIKGNGEIVESILEGIEKSLQDRDPDLLLPKVTECLAAIRIICQCCDYQKIICDDVLDLAKLNEKKMELHITSFDPCQITQDAVQMLRVRAQQGSVQLIAECKMKSRIVTGDATRLTQVLVNLISNAIKFTPAGGAVTVTLQSLSETVERIQLMFSVKDTGMGISEEQQRKLFSPFMQASSAIATQYGGTGLGLSISKSLVELMNGSIRVESVLGKGSTFVATVYCGNLMVAATPVLQTRQLTTAHRKLHVLVADDNVINQRIIRRMLENAGHSCAIANNGQEALNLWMQMDHIDSILMDLNMPSMGGAEATQRIRQMERARLDAPPTWIIGLSGDDESDVAWRDFGMNDYVVKPYNQNDLLDKIARVPSPRGSGS